MKKMVFIVVLMLTTSLMAESMSKMDLINKAKKEVGEISPKQLKALLDKSDDIIVLDVREAKQRSEGSIPWDDFNKEYFHAVTRGNLEWKINKIIPDKDEYIVTYCRRGGRGALAAQVMKKMGYTHVTTLKGGLKGWAKAGYPVKTGLGVVTLKDKQ